MTGTWTSCGGGAIILPITNLNNSKFVELNTQFLFEENFVYLANTFDGPV